MAVPKLRFKEFDGDWSEKVISDIADVRGGKRLPKGYSLVESDTGYPYITVTDMEDGTVNCDKIRYVPLDAVDQIKRYRITVDDIYISVAGTLGLVGIIPHELNNANLTENADKLTNIKCDQKYLLQYLNNGSLSQLIDSVSTVGAQPKLALYAIQGMSIFLPATPEQTKIASFLSAVDEKIRQLKQKHQLLSQYKQAMMQKLFSKQIRFKADDGSEFGEWEEKKLGEICQFINGRAYKQTEWEKEGIPVIRLQNLTGSGKEYYYSNLNLPAHQYCYNNDLLYMWSATFGPVFWQGEKAIFHYHIWKIEVNPSLLDRKYMYFLLDEMTEKMKRSLNGSTMLHVTKQGMENTQKIVPSLPEQTKIANFLSAIDQKINVVSEQLEQAKLWKKGLLQQMFV
nr:restriction endonuclease subunit S [Acinetobacter sp. YH12120]